MKNQTTFTGGVIANQRLYDFGYTSNLVGQTNSPKTPKDRM